MFFHMSPIVRDPHQITLSCVLMIIRLIFVWTLRVLNDTLTSHSTFNSQTYLEAY